MFDEPIPAVPALVTIYLIPPYLVESGGAPLLDDNGQPLRDDEGRILYGD